MYIYIYRVGAAKSWGCPQQICPSRCFRQSCATCLRASMSDGLRLTPALKLSRHICIYYINVRMCIIYICVCMCIYLHMLYILLYILFFLIQLILHQAVVNVGYSPTFVGAGETAYVCVCVCLCVCVCVCVCAYVYICVCV